MKIIITQTIIEIDFPDQSDETVTKISPYRPFPKQQSVGSQSISRPKNGCSKVSCNNLLQLLENKLNGYFLTQ
jgi:hypothetical protein